MRMKIDFLFRKLERASLGEGVVNAVDSSEELDPSGFSLSESPVLKSRHRQSLLCSAIETSGYAAVSKFLLDLDG